MPTCVPLPSGGHIDFTGTTAAENPQLAGLVIVDELIPFTYPGHILPPPGTYVNSGTIQNRIVRTLSGTLDFYWRIVLDSGEAPLRGIVVRYFGGPSDVYNFDYRIDGLGDVAPTGASRSLDNTYVFGFPYGQLLAGKSSKFFFAETNVTHYLKTPFINIYDSYSQSGSIYPSYGPVFRLNAPRKPLRPKAPHK